MKKILAIVLTFLIIMTTFASCASAGEGTLTGDGSGTGLVQNPTNNGTPNNGGNANPGDNDSEGSESESGEAESEDASDTADGEIEAAGAVYIKNGNNVTFGSYPQARVSDTTLIASLEAKAGGLPSTSDKWKDCSGVTDMVYVDVEEAGKKYRGIYFAAYRDSGTGTTLQSDNGYYTNTAYWFEYQPIEWTVLEEKDGKAFILCKLAIDSQAFDLASVSYDMSSIRTWINQDFYNAAFNKLQQAAIADTSINGSNLKVFIPSELEITQKLTSASECQRAATDYSKAMGQYVDGSSIGWWWLRDASSMMADRVSRIKVDGTLAYISSFTNSGGVVPALWLTLAPQSN